MANIATVQVAAYLRPGASRRSVPGNALLRRLTQYYGISYHVPTWRFDDYPRGVIYVQYGEKWSPTSVSDAWDGFDEHLDAMWVRWYDDGGDHDRIFIFTGDFGESRLCRYGFDSVRLHATEPPGAGWRFVRPGVWEADLSGTYLAGNDRCNLLAELPRMSSCTTPVRGHGLSGPWELYPSDEFPPAAHDLAPLVNAIAEGLEFCWHRRPARVYQKRGGWWWQWNLDDWDNCRDPVWLAYRAARPGLAPTAPPVS